MRFLLVSTSVCLFLGCLVSDRVLSVGGDDCQGRDNVGSRECSKRCNSDRDCVSSRKKCICDGVCGMRCINLNLRCIHLEPTIPHGRVDILPYNRFGAVARYSCNEGYTLFGRPMRVCQGDETWSDTQPTCEINQVIEKHECGLPPVVHHASHNGDPLQQTYPLGSHLLYECHNGFVAKRESVYRAWCVGAGVWVGPNMTCTKSFTDAGCPEPPRIQDGAFEVIPPFHIGSKVRYTCNPGFHLLGPQERTCQADATWDLHPPTCERDGDPALTGSRYRPSPVVCGPPPVVEHATHSGSPDTMQYPAGSKLLYTCDFGYYNKGIPNAVCQGSEGTWLGPMMDCVARDCGTPGEIENGYRDPGYRFVYPTRVTYHCNEGYELIGRAFRECQANGEWTGTLPKCEPITCTELGPPLHGTMIGSGRTYGSVIRFVCNEGYKVVGSAERTCQADRMWSGQEAHCEEIDCGVPGPLWNGYLDGHRTTVGAVYFFRCHVRTKFEGVSFSTQCMENGQWSHPPPKCMGQCAVPAILNGSVQDGRPGVFVDHGTEVRLTCDNGRVLNDTSPVRCSNGTWTVIPRCIPAPCRGVPPLIENGHRIFFGLHHGDRARYFCFEGYKLHNDNQYLTCEFGQWNGPRPFCEENYCPNPGQIINGKVFKKGQVGKFPFSDYIISIEHGERLEYECHRGYKLVGPRGAACVNGRWSPDLKPQCIQSRHPILHKLWRPIEENESVDIYG